MDEVANIKDDDIPSGICYEQLHPCIGGCWCCFGGHGYCYSTKDECKTNCHPEK